VLAFSTAVTNSAGDAQQTPLPSGINSQDSQETSELSGGLIAGAAVGGTLGFVALLVLGYLMVRRLLKMRQQTGHPPPPPGAFQPAMAHGYQDYSQPTTAVGPAGYGYPGQSTDPAGVMAKHVDGHPPNAPVELPAAPRVEFAELR
jgi:hypothetical protein